MPAVAVRIVRLPCCGDVQAIGCSQNIATCDPCKRWAAIDDCEGTAVASIPYHIDPEGDIALDDDEHAYSSA